MRDIRDYLLSQDVILVLGGNTANLLAVWRAHGVDLALKEAWEAGVVLCGGSAGSLCWFECGTTDSFDVNELKPLYDGLGFLPGSHCPHYDGEEKRRPLYHSLISEGFPPGYAIDDDAAIHFTGTEVSRSGQREGWSGSLPCRADRGTGSRNSSKCPTDQIVQLGATRLPRLRVIPLPSPVPAALLQSQDDLTQSAIGALRESVRPEPVEGSPTTTSPREARVRLPCLVISAQAGPSPLAPPGEGRRGDSRIACPPLAGPRAGEDLRNRQQCPSLAPPALRFRTNV